MEGPGNHNDQGSNQQQRGSYKARIATHPNRLAVETFKTTNMDRRLKRKHPADLIKDIT